MVHVRIADDILEPGDPDYTDINGNVCLSRQTADVPPAEFEAAHYRHHAPLPRPATQAHRSPDTPGRYRDDYHE